jgi:RNA polymerase sigma factor (sigma-70 family)
VSPLFGKPWANPPGARAAVEDDGSAALVAQLPRLRRYAIALVGDISLADDLLQDCIERALKHRRALKEQQSTYAWLRSILHNLYMDELRRRRRDGIVADMDELTNSLMHSAPSADRSSTMDFVQAMSRLSGEHRQVLLLVGLEGLSYRETAAELKVPIGTVMSRLARAREHLREMLDQADSDTGLRTGR